MKKGDVDKKDVDDLKRYLFDIGEPIDKKEADELPEIKHEADDKAKKKFIYDSFGNATEVKSTPDYSKVLDTEQFLDSEYEKAVNKAKSIDYSGMPTDDQLPYEPGKIKVDKSTEAIERDYFINSKAMDEFEKEWSEKQNKREGIAENYYNNLETIMSNDKNVQNITDLGHQGSNFGEYNPISDPDYAFNNYNKTFVTEAVKCISENDINKYYYMRGLYKKGLIDEQTLIDFENHLYYVGGQIYENNRKRTEQAKGNLNYDKKPIYNFQSGVRGIEDSASKVLQLIEYYIGNKVAPQVKTAENTAYNESRIRLPEEQKEKGENIRENIKAIMPWGKISDFSNLFFYYKKQGYTEQRAFYKAFWDTISFKENPSPADFYDEHKTFRNIIKKLPKI